MDFTALGSLTLTPRPHLECPLAAQIPMVGRHRLSACLGRPVGKEKLLIPGVVVMEKPVIRRAGAGESVGQ